MASITAIQTLTDLCVRQAEEVATRLGQANAQHNKSLQKLQLLKDYRQSYAQKFQDEMGLGLGMSHYSNYLCFLANLDKAVAQQNQEVALNQHILDQLKREWQETERKRLSYETLKSRYQTKQIAADNKREQKLNDEFAMRSRSLGL